MQQYLDSILAAQDMRETEALITESEETLDKLHDTVQDVQDDDFDLYLSNDPSVPESTTHVEVE